MSVRLDRLVREIRATTWVKPMPVDMPTSVWVGSDVIDGRRIDSLTIILRTIGCRWQGCTMCGYVYDCATHPVSSEDLIHQFEEALKSAPDGPHIVKIYTSGSFFDEREVPVSARNRMLNVLGSSEDVVKVIAETRPEHVTSERVEEAVKTVERFEIAVGLETSSDLIGEECINKGFSFSDFIRASEVARSCRATTRAYLLLKPPFLSEPVAVEDMRRSIRDASPYAETISMNLMTVQRGTLVERLWERGGYRPPWLWSAIDVLLEAKVDSWLLSDPVGAGTRRGPHNCGKCDREVAGALREFSLTQDKSILRDLECDCQSEWQSIMELDDAGFGSPI